MQENLSAAQKVKLWKRDNDTLIPLLSKVAGSRTELQESELNLNHDLICLVDWLQFTIKTESLDAVYKILGIDDSEFSEMPTGLYSYKKRKACGNIWVMYDGMPDMGIHVQISGQGCREYETYHNGNWFELFKMLIEIGANVTRLDIAIDDICFNEAKPYFTVRQLIRKAKRGECRTKWKSGIRQEKFDFGSGKSKGDTLYCGSNSSLIQLVIYEKDHERKNNDIEIEENLTTWNRCELRLYDDRADEAVQWVVRGYPVGKLAFGILSNYINFVDRTNDTNKARWPVSKFWRDFLNDAEKLSLARKAPDKTIESKMTWIDKQVKPTLAEIWIALGSPGEDFFVDIINEGLERMNETQWQRAQDYKLRMDEIKQKEKEHQKKRIERFLERRQEKKIEPLR